MSCAKSEIPSYSLFIQHLGEKPPGCQAGSSAGDFGKMTSAWDWARASWGSVENKDHLLERRIDARQVKEQKQPRLRKGVCNTSL